MVIFTGKNLKSPFYFIKKQKEQNIFFPAVLQKKEYKLLEKVWSKLENAYLVIPTLKA